jgi:hypothetical protein
MLSPSTRATAVVRDEVAPDDERLRKSLWTRLDSVGKLDSPPFPVAEQRLEARRVLGVEMTRMSRMPASISVDKG